MGGKAETSRPTLHAEPKLIRHEAVYHCVASTPRAAARASAFGLDGAMLPIVPALAHQGAKRAWAEDRRLLAGLAMHAGRIAHGGVAGPGATLRGGGPLRSAAQRHVHAMFSEVDKRFDRVETRMDRLDARLESVEGEIAALLGGSRR